MRSFLKRLLISVLLCLCLAMVLPAEENAEKVQQFQSEREGLHYLDCELQNANGLFIYYMDPKSVREGPGSRSVELVVFMYSRKRSDLLKIHLFYEFDTNDRYRDRSGSQKQFSAWKSIDTGSMIEQIQRYVFLSKTGRDISDEKVQSSPPADQTEAETQMTEKLEAVQ